MPLLNRDTGRGGGSRENRRSLVEIYNSDPSEVPGNAAAPVANRTNGADEGPWRWEAPGSPPAAPSPRALVPSACFPQDHSAAMVNFSELAMPGSWATEPCEGITDLVESFLESWPPEGACSLPPEGARGLSRRSSYCERNGGAAEEARAGAGAGAGAGGVARAEPRLLTWRGALPARGADPSPPGGFSAKVFMGGLPWDITEDTLKYALRDFQPLRVEWPGSDAVPRGFAYVTLESERRVRALLHAARRHAGKWVYRLTARDLRYKDVEVIPWALADTNWVCAEAGVGGVGGVGASSLRLEPTRTVFVGALHGVLSASALALIMNDLFSGVVYAGIDTDKSKYPIGSGRVTFNNVHSYVRAISAAYVEIRTDKFVKKIQVDPYLEDSMCSVCNLQQGPYFCREPVCFKYFCRSCWARRHAADSHKPLMRNSKIGAHGTNWNAANGTNWNANSSNWDAANDTNGSSWGGANGSSWGDANGSNWGGANGSNWSISKWNGANGSNWSVSNWNGSNGNGSSSDTQANATTPSPSPSTSGTSGSSRTSSGTSADNGGESLALERLSLA